MRAAPSDADLREIVGDAAYAFDENKDASHAGCMICYPVAPKAGDTVMSLCGVYGQTDRDAKPSNGKLTECTFCQDVTARGVCMKGHSLRG